MKKLISILLALSLVASLAACSKTQTDIPATNPVDDNAEPPSEEIIHGESDITYVNIVVSDEGVYVDDVLATSEGDVYVANDVVYYESGKDFTYGEGSEKDAHSAEEAAAHTVVHITKPGDYFVSGSLSAGQIAIDLGKEAKEDPNAVVNLYLNGVNITNTVAPGIIFYNVYECGNDDTEAASADVDTSAAGANIFIVGGTENVINGSYVARIYKPDSVVLNEDKTKVEEAKKLHKYDGAVYSRMSMNVNCWEGESGSLFINAENEGLDTEMHLTINGGYINIRSGNDGINTNEDGVSVTTISGGTLNIVVTGTTGEGDGIDSNGWLVINGGTVTTQACDFSMDAGIDSDMGIHINGGTVCVTGNMLDRISDSKQNFVVFEFNKAMSGALSLKDSADVTIAECATENSFKYLLFSNESIVPGEYTLWEGFGIQHEGYATSNMGGFGGRPGGTMPDGVKLPENVQPGETPPNFPEGNFADMTPPPGGNFEIPYPPANADEPQNKGERKEQFDGQKPDNMFSGENKKNKGEKPIDMEDVEVSNIFTIQEGANYFYIVIS